MRLRERNVGKRHDIVHRCSEHQITIGLYVTPSINAPKDVELCNYVLLSAIF